MYKRRFVSAIFLCLLELMTLSGCDFFRRLAGRPTSAEIELKREAILREQAAHQARLDSLRRIEKAAADSLEMLDRIKESGELILPFSTLRRAKASGLDKRYYIIAGAFSSSDNASWLAAKVQKAGYDVVKIPYGNGFTAVGVAGTDSLSGLWANLSRVKQEEFCPKDMWILVNE